MTYELIADDGSLRDIAPYLRSQSVIALDCEAAGFHRYSDRLCLVQLSTPGKTFLFDPLATDPSPVLRPVLEDPEIQVVMHGADFDLRLLDRDLDIHVKRLFDTQAAATLLGASSIGLAALLEEHLGIRLAKEHQRADWARRPLPDALLDYAAEDTRHLLELAKILRAALREKGREEWAAEEFRVLEEIRWGADETDPVTRIKMARHLSPRQVTALRAALEWRDGIARNRDRAPFRVVGDSVLLETVLERPRSVEALAGLKGMSPRLAEEHGEELLSSLALVDSLPEDDLQPYPRNHRNGPGRLPPEEEAMADEIRKLRSREAEALGLERGVVLSNAQITAIVRSAPRSQAALLDVPGVRSWQMELLGEKILRIFSRS